MSAFFTDMGTNPFLLTGLLAGLLASVPCGIVGPYVVTRRLVFLAGAIAHIAIGGVGAAIFLAHRFPHQLGWLTPMRGATVAAVGAAVLLAVLHERARERIDTLVGALWATGMAVGILLVKLTPGYQTELMSYLFGSLVFVGWPEVAALAGLAVVVLAVALLFHKRFGAVCLDPQQAALQGISVLGTQVVLAVLVALTVVALTRIVGLILVIALLALPAAAAGRLVSRLPSMIWLSVLACALLTTLPRIAVYGTVISPEAAIVLSAGALYLAAVAGRRRPARS